MTAERPPPQVLLLAMPWTEPGLPSIQLGILQAVIAEAGLRVEARSTYLVWLEHLLAAGLGVSDYLAVATKYFGFGLGDWIFAVPPLREPDRVRDERYLQWLGERVPAVVVHLARRLRELAPAFINACADDILTAPPIIVGFTVAFDQTLPSLALARALKLRRPELHVIFGGACCEGPMGAALHRSSEWIDTIVRGEAELVLPDLLRDLLTGTSPRPLPGLCYRLSGQPVVVPQQAAQRPDMDAIPRPDYDEYFAQLRASPALRRAILPECRLPFESARGCWWGERMHCSFCGLNGEQMAFTTKSTDRVLDDIQGLATRYQRLDLEAVDNIIAREHLRSLLPELGAMRRRGYDLRFFYETKANLRREEVRQLREAGVLRIQPGIESLSSPILRLMKKGVTALMNVRLLKWAEQYGVRPVWNIIYGFPGEQPEEYAAMAQRVPMLSHLKPPALVRLKVQRFSPYHERAREHGLSLTGPAAHYRFLFDSDDATLWDLAYDFDYTYTDSRDPESYVAPLAAAVAKWDAAFHNGSSLRYERGPGFLRIRDQRPDFPPRAYLFEGVQARIYLACDAGATALGVWQSLDDGERRQVTPDEVQSLLAEIAAAGLLYEEKDRYLSLALPTHVDLDAVGDNIFGVRAQLVTVS